MFSTKFLSYSLVIMLFVSFLPADISRDKLIAPVCNMISRSIPRAIENHPGDEKPIIFKTTTIIENIAFGQNINDIDIERIKESSKKAKIYSFINTLPKKFYTNIGEMGSNLSGGQAQRIALARSFYNYKKVLIMDEATSSLDEKTEREVVESIKINLND